MAFRHFVSPIPIIGTMLALVMLVAVACGGAEAPAPDDAGASQPVASSTTGTESQQAPYVRAGRSIRGSHVGPGCPGRPV